MAALRADSGGGDLLWEGVKAFGVGPESGCVTGCCLCFVIRGLRGGDVRCGWCTKTGVLSEDYGIAMDDIRGHTEVITIVVKTLY